MILFVCFILCFDGLLCLLFIYLIFEIVCLLLIWFGIVIIWFVMCLFLGFCFKYGLSGCIKLLCVWVVNVFVNVFI